MKLVIALCALLFACHTGDLGETCNKDGTCNNVKLHCGKYSERCTIELPPALASKCTFESECFCVTCAEKCGEAGVKECAFSDTSVWGSKPAFCECK